MPRIHLVDRTAALIALLLFVGEPSRAAFPPLLEISGTVEDADGSRPLSDYVASSFLVDYSTDEAAFTIDLRASDHPDSTAEVVITLETFWSSEGSSSGCAGVDVRAGFDVVFEVSETTNVVEIVGQGNGAEQRYTEMSGAFYYESMAGGSNTGCLADGGSRHENWGSATVETRDDDDGQHRDDSSGFPPGQASPPFVPTSTGSEKLHRRFPRSLEVTEAAHVATFAHEYVHPGGDEAEGGMLVNLRVGQAIGTSSIPGGSRTVTESVVHVRVVLRKRIDGAGPVTNGPATFSSLKARFGG